VHPDLRAIETDVLLLISPFDATGRMHDDGTLGQHGRASALRLRQDQDGELERRIFPPGSLP